jgi:hypothetical protein
MRYGPSTDQAVSTRLSGCLDKLPVCLLLDHGHTRCSIRARTVDRDATHRVSRAGDGGDPALSRARWGAAAVWRVAGPPGPTRRRARAAPRRPRPVRRGRDGGVRRATPAESCSQRATRCVSAAPRRVRSSRRRRSRSPRLARDGCRTRRSAVSCSSARVRSSGICARSSPSSASAPAGSFASPARGRPAPRTCLAQTLAPPWPAVCPGRRRASGSSCEVVY